MGMSVSAKLIVGLPGSKMVAEHSEMIANGELDYASPYYDSWVEEQIIGVDVDESNTYSALGLRDDLEGRISKAHEKFTELTGLEGILYLCPHVT